MAKDFLIDFESRIVRKKPGFASWFEALPADAKESLGKIKKKFLDGGYRGTPKTSLAKAVVAIASDRGWVVSGVQGVIDWLERKT